MPPRETSPVPHLIRRLPARSLFTIRKRGAPAIGILTLLILSGFSRGQDWPALSASSQTLGSSSAGKQTYSPEYRAELLSLGESYRRHGDWRRAEQTYAKLLDRFDHGDDVGRAAFCLGFIRFRENDFRKAQPLFDKAQRELECPDQTFQARYFEARSHHSMGNSEEAMDLYESLGREITDSSQLSHFQDKSRLEAARILFEKGESKRALEHFRKLAGTTGIPAIQEEAAIRTAILSIREGDLITGKQWLARCTLGPDSPWKPLERICRIYIAFSEKDYRRVIALYGESSIITHQSEYRPEVLLMIADSLREENHLGDATRLYSLIGIRYPETVSGVDAGYRKLRLLYARKSRSFATAANHYISLMRTHHGKDCVHIDRARLLIAEWYLGQAGIAESRDQTRESATELYNLASSAYESIRLDHIEERFRPSTLYHHAWSLFQSGQRERGDVVVARIRKLYPESASVPAALATQGDAALEVNELESAFNIFTEIVTQYPLSVEREVALERISRIHGSQDRIAEMVQSYLMLIDNFPDTPSRAEACFWVGVGYFDMEDFGEALPFLREAAQLNPDLYSNRAGIRVILCHHHLEQRGHLLHACRVYLQRNTDAGVLNEMQKLDRPEPIPRWLLIDLGHGLLADKNFIDAEFFLTQAVDPSKPESVPTLVWKDLGIARMKSGIFEGAIEAFDLYLLQAEDRDEKGFAYLHRGMAEYALERFEHSRQSAYECLRLSRQGRINANARMLLADSCSALGNTETAIQEYIIVSQIYDDHFITPLALARAIDSYRKLGRPREVATLEKHLKERFPSFHERVGKPIAFLSYL